MHPTRSEVALRRLLAYLGWSGVAITPEVERCALETVAQALDSDESELIAACMQRLAQHAPAPQRAVGVVAPPIRRGSIAYGDY